MTTISSSIDQLTSSIRGEIIEPGHAQYEDARRVFNGMIDRCPRFIVRAVDVADVIAGVNFAREEGLVLSVRGGGHNVAGFGTNDNGLVIDLSRMKGIQVDPEKRTVRAQGGCTWGDVDHATHVFGLAAAGGVVSTTGVGGLTLGGGIGYQTRKAGLACDNIISADVVTADGRLLTASETENVDLLWALRGGGGNFGVVTSFEFRLHETGTVYAGPVLWPLELAADAMRNWGRQMLEAPEEMNALFGFLVVPAEEPFPEPLHNKNMCAAVVC
jgi:FAD/FMN-containing dehydrogenase